MLNDRNELPEDHEENEYHFSDEDVSYDVETESSKPASTQSKQSIVSRLMQSKRLLISSGVFLVLIFFVYKLIAPTASTVTPEISTPITTVQQTNTNAPSHTMQSPAVPTQQPAPAVEVAVTPPTGVAPTTEQTSPQSQPVASMPPVIPVQGPAGEMIAPMPVPTPTPEVTSATTESASSSTPIDAAIAQLNDTNARLMSQLESDYTQKMTEFSAQNKVLQDQMQSLNSRVAVMEAQLNQLVQALTQQNNPQQMNPAQAPIAPTSMMAPKPIQAAPAPKIAYSVQAIIPGRAWLRSENGEAITVAEGDTIKDVGRVTKIDPYDGIVEVNTGSRTVLLSYGNGNE